MWGVLDIILLPSKDLSRPHFRLDNDIAGHLQPDTRAINQEAGAESPVIVMVSGDILSLYYPLFFEIKFQTNCDPLRGQTWKWHSADSSWWPSLQQNLNLWEIKKEVNFILPRFIIFGHISCLGDFNSDTLQFYCKVFCWYLTSPSQKSANK